tara:strand:+ start:1302 stop:3239 length:1938 start_codon:yes stop_codon:yes gene_type:complete
MAGDPYFSSVQLLLHGDGSNAGTVFPDASRQSYTLIRTGNVVTSTAQFKYGTASILFDGTSDGLATSSSAALTLGANDFTIECWVRPVTGGRATDNDTRIWQIGLGATNGTLSLSCTGSDSPTRLALVCYTGGVWTTIIAAPATTIPNDVWTHVAVTRSGTTWTLWVDGASYATATSSFSPSGTTVYLGYGSGNTTDYNGYIDDFRYTKGVARYTGAFTAPTEAFPNYWEVEETLTDEVANRDSTGDQLPETVTETAGVGEVANAGYTREMEDLLFLTRSLSSITAYILRDTLSSTDSLGVSALFYRSVSDTAGTADVLKLNFGMVVRETLQLDPIQALSLRSKLTVTEIIQLSERLNAGRPITLTDGVGVARAVIGTIGALVLDQLRLTDLITPNSIYKRTQVEGIRIGDALLRFLGGAVSDTASFQDTLTPLYYINRTLTEGVGVAETITPRLVFRLIAQDTFGVDDVQVLKSIHRGTLTDGVEISAAYVSPDGVVTTWAINTKTGAVTEYSNYEFNSFARSGFKYLGAASTGLYELDGDDDAGDNIVSVIKSGLAQFGGSRFTAFKAAYLGIRGGGDFYLRLETGAGEFYNYKIVSQDMETTKVQMGKGLRARYFSFQLTSTGQDFDLESIEFVPLVAQRRV